jgi:ligand-binding sensor domain-containing protein
LAVLDGDRWTVLRSGPTLSEITSVAVTPEGTAWFGFGNADFRPSGGGIAAYTGDSSGGGDWFYEDRLPDVFPPNVRYLAVAPDGDLWAGAGCALLRRGDDGWQTVLACDDLSGNVTFIDVGPDGAVWFTTEFDVYRLLETDLARFEGLVPLSMAVDASGSVWVSSSPLVGGGLSQFDGSVWLTHTLTITTVTSLAAPDDGRVWVAGDGKMLVLDAGVWSPAQVPPAGPGRLVDQAGGPWAITQGAVSQYTNGAWQTVADVGVQINTLAPATDGAVWLGTSLGAVRIDLDDSRQSTD